MIDWGILNIAPTKDKNKIREAYRRVLSLTNPEEDAERFMELRYTYESALKWVDEQEMERQNSVTPINEWMAMVEEVYYDFEQRLSLDAWDELLENDVCVGIESRLEARDALLGFLMEHYNIPQVVWISIDRCFSIIDSKNELYDIFPQDYIDNGVISSIMYPDVINYDLFNRHARIDYDKYIAQYFKLVQLVRDKQVEASEELIKIMEEYGQVHPYFEVQKAKHFINVKKYVEAEDIISKEYMKFPDDQEILFAMAEASFELNKIEEAKKYYKKLLKLNEKHYYAKIGLADCLMKQEEYNAAKEIYMNLHKVNPYDSYLKEKIEEANKSLIKKFEDKCSENPDDAKSKIELGWCYLQNNRLDEAKEVILKVDKKGNEYDYYNLLGRCYLYKSESDNAVEAITNWIEVIKKIEDDGTEETKKKIDKLSYAYEVLGKVYELKNDRVNALKYVEMALEKEPDDTGHLEAKARIMLAEKKYEECIYACDKILEEEDRMFSAYYYKGMALFGLKQYIEAYDQFEEGIKIYPYHLLTYLQEIKILLKYGEFDKVREIVEFIKQQGIESDALLFYSTKTDYEEEVANKQAFENDKNMDSEEETEEKEIDYTKYRAVYIRLLKDYEDKKSDITEVDTVYYEIASTYMAQEKYSKALEYSIRATETNKENIEAYMYMAFIYERLKDFRSAIETNKKILELNPLHFNANNRIAEMHEEFYEYEEALEYHTKQLEITENLYYYMCRGLAYLKLDRFEEARADFRKAIKFNPANPHPYNNIGASYQYEDNYEEALGYYDLAIERLHNEPTPLPYRNMATVYMRLGDIDRAIECYENNIKMFNKPYDYEEMANAFFETKRYKESVDAYTKRCKFLEATNRVESACDLYIWVGKCNLSLGAEKTAFKYYNRAIDEAGSANIKYVPAYIELANLYQIIKNYEMAVRCYEQANEAPSMTPTDFADYAFCLYNVSDYENSEKYAKKALDMIEEMDDRQLNQLSKKFYRLGYCYTAMGKYEEAEKFFDKAINNRRCNTCDFSKCCESIAGKAFMYERQNKLEEALNLYGEALEIYPSSIKYIYAYKRVISLMENAREKK